jgi:membrane-bound lytic murein transglycosylase D
MNRWLLGLLALVLIMFTASDPYFAPIPERKAVDVRNAEPAVEEVSWVSLESQRPYLSDQENRVDDIFKVTDFYYPNVYFWFLIYTQFESTQVVLHDKSNLRLIYKVLDFSSLKKKDMPRNTLYVLQQKVSGDKVKSLKEDLAFLVTNPLSLEPRAQEIYRSIKHADIQLPADKKKRSRFFSELLSNVRTQTGQKNFIHDGIIRSLPYQTFLNGFFEKRKLPRELIAIPFLESSFNPVAHSKVSALGVWQFMPLIAGYYVPKRSPLTDYRSNVGVASIAAAFLMQENIKIMKSWDLAVTAYNSGTKHLLNSKRKMASVDVSLESIIRHSDSEHFGFASKNFYSEFLALAHVMAYRDELFPDIHDHERSDVKEDLRFYSLKCSMRLDRVLTKDLLQEIDFHNHHIDSLSQNLPKGFIITSKSALPSGKFAEIKETMLLKVKPKDWASKLGNQSCSTR